MAQSPRGAEDFFSLTAFSLPPTTASLAASNQRKESPPANTVRHVTIYEPENLKRYATVAPYIPTYIAAVKTDYNVTLDDVMTRKEDGMGAHMRNLKSAKDGATKRALRDGDGGGGVEHDNMSTSDVTNHYCGRFSWEDEQHSLQGTGAGGRSTMSLTNASTALTETATSTWADDDEYFVQYVKNSAAKKKQQRKTLQSCNTPGVVGEGGSEAQHWGAGGLETDHQNDGPRWSDMLRSERDGEKNKKENSPSQARRQQQRNNNNNTNNNNNNNNGNTNNNSSQRKRKGGGKQSAAFGWQLVEESNNGKRFPRRKDEKRTKKGTAAYSIEPSSSSQPQPQQQQQQHADPNHSATLSKGPMKKDKGHSHSQDVRPNAKNAGSEEKSNDFFSRASL